MLKSLFTVGGNTLLSRLLGFARDLAVARVFGADAGTDAFFVAFRIPNFGRRLFAEGAFASALVPALTPLAELSDRAPLRRFLGDLTGTLGLVLLAITLLGVAAAPVLVLLFAPGYLADPERLTLAADLLRLTFPYLLLITLTALAGGVLNALHRFAVPAFTPVLLNLTLIAAALWWSPLLLRPIEALAWGVLLAGLLQLAFQLPFLGRLGLLPRPRFAPREPRVRQLFRRLGPSLLGVSVTQINLLLDTLMASFLTAGSISWLYYAERLMEFPMGVLGVALGTVLTPTLASQRARAGTAAFSGALDWGLRWVLLLGLPSVVGLLVLAGPILATLFHSDRFGAEDVTLAAWALWAYAPGLLGFMGIKVLAPAYFARGDTRTPVRIAWLALLAHLGLGLLLLPFLAHAGLALATSLAALLNAALLLRGLWRQGAYRPGPGWRGLLARGVAASLLLAAVLLAGTAGLDTWLARGAWERVFWLTGWVVAGGLLYLAGALALGVRPRHLRLSS